MYAFKKSINCLFCPLSTIRVQHPAQTSRPLLCFQTPATLRTLSEGQNNYAVWADDIDTGLTVMVNEDDDGDVWDGMQPDGAREDYGIEIYYKVDLSIG